MTRNQISRLAGVPIQFLDVARRYRKLMATFGAARLEDEPTAFGGHTLTKAVHTLTAALLGLVGTLWHNSITLLAENYSVF